jgi:hypothetical protein
MTLVNLSTDPNNADFTNHYGYVTSIGATVSSPNNPTTYGGPNPYVAIPGTLQFTINFTNTLAGFANQRANFMIIN